MSHASVRINNLARLKSSLANSGLQKENPDLYHVADQLISEVQRLYNTVLPASHEESAEAAVPQINQAYLTHHDETDTLNDSRTLLYGAGLQKNDSGKRILISGALPFHPSEVNRGDLVSLESRINPVIAGRIRKVWIPVVLGDLSFSASSGTWTSVDLSYFKYAIIDGLVFVKGALLTSTTSATPNELRVSLASLPIDLNGNDSFGMSVWTEDNFVTQNMGQSILRQSNNSVVIKKADGSNFATVTDLLGVIFNVVGELS